MEIQTFLLNSPVDNLPLKVAVLEPDGEKKGIFQIVHGMSEYWERYEEMMRFFASHGYVAVCHDQRGHGDSVYKEEDRGYFYETSGKAIVEDCVAVTLEMKKRYRLPVYLYGHSMGSMIVRCYLHEHDDLLEKLVVCGTPSNNPLAGVAIALTKTIALFKGDTHRSKMLAYLSTGKGNERFEGEGKGAWLSHNRENIEAFYSHPKGNNRFTCNGFENLFKLMKNTYNKKKYQVKNPTLPIFFVSGSEDAVLGGEKQFDKTVEKMRKIGYQNVTQKLYQGVRHEIHHDLSKDEVLADLLAFIEK